MTTLREAAQQALEAVDAYSWEQVDAARTALRVALAEPEGGDNLPPPLPGDFDHGIGADRFKVVRGAFWWHVLIGDNPTEHGKFHSRAGAEKMAADLLREFRNGAFVQHEAALAAPTVKDSLQVEPAVAENATTQQQIEDTPPSDYRRGYWDGFRIGKREGRIEAEDALAEPVLQTCNCRWDGEMQMQQCTLHEAHVDAIKEWAQRAKFAEKKLAALAEPVEPVAYSVGRTLHWHEGKGVSDAQLFAASPQRKPLTREQAIALWADKSDGPSNGEIVSFTRAIERAHGII